MSDFVIQAVEKMAEDQGIKSLKLFKKNKQSLFPNDWTAGVDYETTNDKNILDEEGLILFVIHSFGAFHAELFLEITCKEGCGHIKDQCVQLQGNH